MSEKKEKEKKVQETRIWYVEKNKNGCTENFNDRINSIIKVYEGMGYEVQGLAESIDGNSLRIRFRKNLELEEWKNKYFNGFDCLQDALTDLEESYS